MTLFDYIIDNQKGVSMHCFIVAYDVFDTKRLPKVKKIVYSYAIGGQKSALEVLLDKNSMHQLLDEVDKELLLIEDFTHRNGGLYLKYEGRKKIWSEFVELNMALKPNLDTHIATLKKMIYDV